MIEGIWTVLYRVLIADTTIISLLGSANVASAIVRPQKGTKITLTSHDGIVFQIPDVTRDTKYAPLRNNDIMISGISKFSDVKAVRLAEAAIAALDDKSYHTEDDIIINQINWLGYLNPAFFDKDINAYRSDALFEVFGSPK